MPKKRVVEHFEEFDYSDLYDDLSVSTVTAGPNITEYEVRHTHTSVFLTYRGLPLVYNHILSKKTNH